MNYYIMLYHEKQIGDFCRLHAINNLIGKQICTPKEFITYCNKFDQINKFVENCSAKKHFYYNNGGVNNIFGFVLYNKNYIVEMRTFDFNRKSDIPINNSKKLLGYIIFDKGHTWCIRKVNNEYFLIDSMKSSIIKVNLEMYIRNKNLFFIEVIIE